MVQLEWDKGLQHLPSICMNYRAHLPLVDSRIDPNNELPTQRPSLNMNVKPLRCERQKGVGVCIRQRLPPPLSLCVRMSVFEYQSRRAHTERKTQCLVESSQNTLPNTGRRGFEWQLRWLVLKSVKLKSYRFFCFFLLSFGCKSLTRGKRAELSGGGLRSEQNLSSKASGRRQHENSRICKRS